jgi:hypothetical protein
LSSSLQGLSVCWDLYWICTFTVCILSIQFHFSHVLFPFCVLQKWRTSSASAFLLDHQNDHIWKIFYYILGYKMMPTWTSSTCDGEQTTNQTSHPPVVRRVYEDSGLSKILNLCQRYSGITSVSSHCQWLCRKTGLTSSYKLCYIACCSVVGLFQNRISVQWWKDLSLKGGQSVNYCSGLESICYLIHKWQDLTFAGLSTLETLVLWRLYNTRRVLPTWTINWC